MSRRRPLPDLSNSHDRWLVSYADFLMLLFAFFVVMYSTAAVTGGSFRSLSSSIEEAFGIQGLSLAKDAAEAGAELQTPMPAAEGMSVLANSPGEASIPGLAELPDEQTKALRDDLMAGAGALLPAGSVLVSSDGDFVDIALPAGLLFPSGARTLLADSLPLIELLADSLRELPNEIVVQGHTDDQPIRNGLFPSNWELSASRASTIVRQLEARGVAPARMSAQGYAATRPLVSNSDEDGRERNRRVLIRVRSALADLRVNRGAEISADGVDRAAFEDEVEALVGAGANG